MSEEITAAAQAAFAAYHHGAAGKPLVMPDSWDMQPDAVQADWVRAMQAGAKVLGALESTPLAAEPAKVIVVTERDRLGRVSRELRYDANQAEVSEYGILRVLRKGSVIGEHQGPGGFSWREEGAIASDGPADKRKLAIALAALGEIAAGDGDEPAAEQSARQALEDIADVDL